MNLIAIEMSCWGGHFQFCVAHYNGTLFGLLGFWKFKSISEIVTQEHFFFQSSAE
jgi:hypothetical protein